MDYALAWRYFVISLFQKIIYLETTNIIILKLPSHQGITCAPFQQDKLLIESFYFPKQSRQMFAKNET